MTDSGRDYEGEFKGYEYELVRILSDKGMTVSVAESCTGGMIVSAIVNVPGASGVLNEAYVTYSNESKHRLINVDNVTLQQYGAVSREVAEQMAEGCRIAAGADIGIATTGIAGPDGGTNEKPVGLVYIGCAVGGSVHVEKHIFSGDRFTVRTCAAECALKNAVNILNEI